MLGGQERLPGRGRSAESESQSKRRSDGGQVQECGGSRNISSGDKGNNRYRAPKKYEAMRPREVKQLAQHHAVHLQKREEQSSVSSKCVPCFHSLCSSPSIPFAPFPHPQCMLGPEKYLSQGSELLSRARSTRVRTPSPLLALPFPVPLLLA